MARLRTLLALGPLWIWVGLLGPAQAAERAYDGAAKAWVSNGQLCLGLEPSYEVAGLMADAATTGQHQVMLDALLVHKNNQVVWQAHAPKVGATTLAMQSQTCLPYGETPAAMSEVIPAQPLSQGLYTVMLVGSDEQNQRAWFYQHFCVGPNPSRLSVTAATFNAAAKRWQCA
ncbi:MAG: hypothetical protein KBC57_12800 [Neisseriaceae bacterium]|nr:hypothetical protein [Neisseriaceae bacterium]MBP6863217.1 hypothetical protein [Neisseriaceae bacterium]